MHCTIRRKLTAWYASLLLLILVILGVVLYHSLQRSLQGEAVGSVIRRAQQIQLLANQSENEPGDSEGNENGQHVAISDPDLIADLQAEGLFVEIIDATGVVVNRSPSLRDTRLIDARILSTLRHAGVGTITVREIPTVERLLVYAAPVSLDDGFLGKIAVGRSLQYIEDALERLRTLLVLLSAGGLLLAIAVGAWLAKRALSPIDRITSTARAITVDELEQRLHLEGPDDEVTRLAAAFDEMLERVEKGFRRERQFTADVAHELRTPLTILKGTAEVALRSDADEPNARRSALESIEEETDRTIRMVEALLLLSRSEAEQLPLDLEDVSLRRVCQDVMTTYASVASARGVDLVSDPLEDLTVVADAERLRQLLANLVANALKYTGRGGRVTVSLQQDGPWAVVSVSDNGVGISEEDLPRVFDRFFRVDRARSRGTDGVGLGLSIARAIARSLGGRIDATSQLGRGTTFTLSLPVSR